MDFSQLRKSIVTSASAMLLLATGCHFCARGGADQSAEQYACQDESASQSGECQSGLDCKKPPLGYVFEQEKEPRKARRNAKKDAKINADGCSPECERYPLLKRIADKENRESEIEVIKVAAKIKHEEEMCQQKIKAVKYLGTIGCCCYDKDGKVADALLAAMNDCLPPVRLAAVQAIAGCVCGQAYNRSCCNEEIAERLQEMAYKTDKNGCPVEPEPLIRQWAAYAAQNCQPKKDIETPPDDLEKSKEVKPEGAPETSPKPLDPSAPTPLTSEVAPTQESRVVFSEVAFRNIGTNTYSYLSHHAAQCTPECKTAAEGMIQMTAAVTTIGPANIVSTPMIESFTVANYESDGEQAVVAMTNGVEESGSPFESALETFSQPQQAVAAPERAVEQEPVQVSTPVVIQQPAPVVHQPAPVQPAQVQPAQVAANTTHVQRVVASASKSSVFGKVESLDFQNELAVIQLPKNMTAQPSSRVHVVHQYALGRLQAIGEFEVVSSSNGTATIRPVAGSSLRKISIGDSATVY